MYSDQDQYSIDYLNQISASAPRNTGNRKLLVVILILGVLSFLAVVMMVFANIGKGPSQDLETLYVRLSNTQKLVKDAQSNLTSNDLRIANSNVSIFLANTNRDIIDPLTKNGINTKKIDPSITAAESDEKLVERLEDARLNAVYDSVYAREMSLRLAEIASLMSRSYNTTKSTSLKTFLEETDKTLVELRKQFDEVNSSSTLQ